jgi:sugar lactone lactonase YvrE
MEKVRTSALQGSIGLRMLEGQSIGGRNQRSAGPRRTLWFCAALLCLAVTAQVLVLPAQAQGPILSVHPGNTAQTLAGNGTLGYSGDNAAATSATLAAPAAVAYDTAGNLYIADADNHVIRKVDTTGIITTIAGSGIEGFAGDGGQATAALLDTPTGVAVDTSGNLYIADSHNQRIRRVNAAGVISTVAGNGTAAFSGDGAAATSASMFLPEAVAVDAGGNLYIADTDNYRIRKVSGGIITTVAGDGEQMYSGDGAAATAAGLDTPTGVAVDTSGNLYIADSHNQRIRMVNAAGIISTIAGNGALGYSGDSGNATQSTLALPTGVAVDAAGNVVIADSDNNVLRQVSNGVINTIAGNGNQGYGGDNGAALNATLNTPRSASFDALGNVGIADSQNQRIRAMELPQLTFASQPVGSVSAPQSVTLSNIGSASLQVQTVNLAGNFALASGGTCSAAPITLAAGASCTVNLAFAPVATGAATGSILLNGAGLTPQTLLLRGSGVQGVDALHLSGPATTMYGTGTLTATLASGTQTATGTVTFLSGSTALSTVALSNDAATFSAASLPVGTYSITASYSGDANYPAATSAPFSLVVTQAGTATTLSISGIIGSTTTPLTFTAQVVSTTSGAPTGTVSFFNGSALLGTSALSANGQAVFTPTTSSLNAGANSITAVYSGGANFSASTSAPVVQTWTDFALGIAANSSALQTVPPGGKAVYILSVTPVGGTTLPDAITMTATGLPSGATYTFAPATIPSGSGATTTVLTIQTPPLVARKGVPHEPAGHHPVPMALGLLLLPLAAIKPARKRMQRMPRIWALLLFAVLGLGAATGLSGCSGGGFFNAHIVNSAITVTATSGTVQHSIHITLTVE